MTRQSASPALLLFVALMAGAAGFTGGFLFRSPSVAHAGGGLGPTPMSSTAAGAGAPVSLDDSELVVPDDSPARAAGGLQKVPDAVPKAVLRRGISRAAAPSIEVASGKARITGSVRASGGEPIPGVTVFLIPPSAGVTPTRKASESMGDTYRTRSLDQVLKQAAKSWSKSEGLARRTETDASGDFQFEGLPERDFRIRAEAEGWRFQQDGPSLIRASAGATGRRVELEGKPLMSFTLHLVSTTGAPIREAVVNLGNGSNGWLGWSAENPIARSTVVRPNVSAVADIYDDLSTNYRVVGGLRSQNVPVFVAEDGSTVLELELEPDCVLTGRVEGSRHGFAGVFAVQLREGERFDPSVELSGQRETSGASGVYVLYGLMPGRYAVGIQANDNEVLDHQIVEIVDGRNELDLTRRALNPARCIAVRSYAPSGVQLEDVSYGLEWTRDGEGRDSEGLRTFEDVAGVDMVDLDNFYSFDIDKWPDGTKMFLYAHCSGFGKAVVPYRFGQREAEIRFETPCELEVAISGDIAGGGYSIALYQDADDETDSPRHLATARQDRGGIAISRAGVATFRGLAPGQVTVKLERTMRWWGGGIPMAEQELTLSGSEHRVEFQAPKLSDLVLVLAPAEKDRNVSLMVVDLEAENGERNAMWGETNSEGRCVFRGVPPGSYTALDSKTGARLEVTAPSPEIRWDLTAVTAEVLVTVSRLDGKLAEWGFKGGDRVLSMAGEPIRETDDILKHLHAEGATFELRRGEETVTLKVPAYPRSTRKDDPLGGGFYTDRRK